MSNKEINTQKVNNQMIIIRNRIVSKIKKLYNNKYETIKQNLKELYIIHNQMIKDENIKLNIRKRELLSEYLQKLYNYENRNYSVNSVLSDIDNIEWMYKANLDNCIQKINECNHLIEMLKLIIKAFNFDENEVLHCDKSILEN